MSWIHDRLADWQTDKQTNRLFCYPYVHGIPIAAVILDVVKTKALGNCLSPSICVSKALTTCRWRKSGLTENWMQTDSRWDTWIERLHKSIQADSTRCQSISKSAVTQYAICCTNFGNMLCIPGWSLMVPFPCNFRALLPRIPLRLLIVSQSVIQLTCLRIINCIVPSHWRGWQSETDWPDRWSEQTRRANELLFLNLTDQDHNETVSVEQHVVHTVKQLLD